MADATFKGLADVLKLLPTSTVIVYEVLNPIVTNAGACSAANRAVTAVLLVLCAFTCAFSVFTDSFIGADGKVRYDLVAARGLLPFGGAIDGLQVDFSKYRLRLSDFAHAVLSVTVFAAVALLADANTVDKKFKSIVDVLKLLPTSTVIVYEMLNPIVTNAGVCSAANRAVTAALLVLCALTCAFSAFTDSFVDGADGEAVVRYGLVTPSGLLPFGDGGGGGVDFYRYRLRPSDFANALLSVTVFAAVTLLADSNTVACFYPALLAQQKQLVVVLSVVIGAVASLVFTVFPSKRHEIVFPPPTPLPTQCPSR